MRSCAACGRPVEQKFRYCPWCAAPQRMKLVEFFFAHPGIEGDRGKALRVSRYFGLRQQDRHVRFSVWSESGEAEAALSLEEPEAARLARFVLDPSERPHPAGRSIGSLLGQLRLSTRR
jgi:hypothetical protein